MITLETGQGFSYASSVKKKLQKLALTALLATVCSAQQPAPPQLRIKVTDQSGALVQRAQIKIVTVDSLAMESETDEKGQASVLLPSGCSQVFANSQGFKTSVLYVDGQEANDARYVPLVLRVGDTFNPYQSEYDLLVVRPHANGTSVSPSRLLEIHHTNVAIHNPLTNADETYSGVTIGELFATLGMSLDGKDVFNGITVSGVEYVQFSRAAEFLKRAVIADSVDGHAIGKTFPFRFVVPEGRCPALVVYNFVRLDVIPAK
jgi:hypothetical protein